MIHIIQLGVLTVCAATLTFALMGLGSLAGAAYRHLTPSIPECSEALKKGVVRRTRWTGRDG